LGEGNPEREAEPNSQKATREGWTFTSGSLDVFSHLTPAIVSVYFDVGKCVGVMALLLCLQLLTVEINIITFVESNITFGVNIFIPT
jgi:hypothetical protein